MQPFSWVCPYCRHAAAITDERYSITRHQFNMNNVHGTMDFTTTVIVCPNPECRQFQMKACLRKGAATGEIVESWQLRPNSSSKPLPSYVPAPIIEDYNEACLIRDLSPKASATLARRCLQGMIRDFWGISKHRLVDEIKALEDKLDPGTWEAIDAVRDVGNIGAHMEKDINVIVEVDPDEAQMLIDLIELLVKEWYIARYNREQRVNGIKKLAAEKKAAKNL